MLVALILLSAIEFDTKVIKTEPTPLTISFLNENMLDNIKEIKTKNEDSRVKNLTIDEKIELYNKLKTINTSKTSSNRVIYEKSTKNTGKTNNRMPSNDVNSDENVFSYYYTPVYVAEDRVNTEEKRKLIENRLKRQELRKKLKERNIIPNVDTTNLKQIKSMNEIITISQKPLVVKKDKKIQKNLEKEDRNINTIVSKDNEDTPSRSNVNELITEISMAEGTIDEKYEGLDKDRIFNDEDYEKLKEMNEDKADTKYMLSLREKKNIQRQIKGCYKMAILRSRKDSKAIVALTVKVEQDGIINMNSIKVSKIVDNFDEAGFDVALDNAKSALVFCSPLRGLPIGKYRSWKQMTFVFDSNNLE